MKLREFKRPIDPETGLEEQAPPKSEYIKYFLYTALAVAGIAIAGFFALSFIYGTILK